MTVDNRLKRVLFAGVCILLLGVGCSSKKDTTEITVFFPNYIWNRFEPVDTVFTVSDANKVYDVSLMLSIMDGFKLDMIPLEIVITSPDGQENIITKTFALKDKEGNHIGSVFGNTWTVELPVYTQKEFQPEGKYTISILNRTQYYDLPLVKSLSLKIFSVKKQE
ncbi:MAG: gliding motility lipoprotein GldH [Bacteroidales bacterium]|jgi:gliding motility-associated lipoprotein GldH|nr:gliding motility lipoprotein GldH [Bacteroidales bacterium]